MFVAGDHAEMIVIERVIKKRATSTTEDNNKKVAKLMPTDPDKFEMVRHLQVKLRENRAVFDALFGANYNVVNTAKLYCPICGKLARLSATGGFAEFRSHLKDNHPDHPQLQAILKGLTKGAEPTNLTLDTTGMTILAVKPPNYFGLTRYSAIGSVSLLPRLQDDYDPTPNS